jgi:hypothetical protein
VRLDPSSTSNIGLVSADRVLVQGAVDATTILERLEVLESVVDGTLYITLIEALGDASLTPTVADQAFTFDPATDTFSAIDPATAPVIAGDDAAIKILNASGDIIAYYTVSSEIYVIDDTLDNPEAQSDVTVDDWIYLGPVAAIESATTLPLTLMGVLR